MLLTRNKITKILKRKRRKFVKSMFTRSSDWTLLAEDGELDLSMFNDHVDYYNSNERHFYHSEGAINIINDFYNIRLI
jgi:hypothetical protein